MKTVPAGEFKTHCLALLNEVATTHEGLVVTRYGKPVARVIPYAQETVEKNPLKGSIVFEGDLISPIEADWNVEL